MKKIITLLGLFFLLQNSYANNVVISNVSLVNNGGNNVFVQFDVSWENSWRILNGPANYDGVWLYFKYKTATGSWTHLNLNPSTTADLIPAGFSYWRSPYGSVLHRSASNLGIGNISATGIRLAVNSTVPYNIELRAFAVEMVYIPASSVVNGNGVALGDGDGISPESTSAFHKQGFNLYAATGVGFSGLDFISVDVNAFDDAEIEEPNSFTIANASGDGIQNLTINNNFFPVSSAIWCMKYEVTQGAYRDFLNTLTLTQQITRTAISPTLALGTGALTTSGSGRNFLEIRSSSTIGLPATYGCDASGNNIYDEANDGEFVACNFLSWPDLAAWLDWAGLAPMTEIQFERICRGHTSAGFNVPVTGEFAWGSTTISANILSLATPFTTTETVSNSSVVLGNANYGSLATGPLRNGIFATASSSRITSGSSFFGAMEMSGNLSEVCVNVGNVAGRSFNRTGVTNSSIGDGIISFNGNAIANYWPGNTGLPVSQTNVDTEVTSAAGTIRRGGDFAIGATKLRVSDRSDGSASFTRVIFQGGRGVIVLAMY
ncbi:MAG: hypothetical protein LH615_12480 [Ferruginibacter sp.]|nr:hypothetical protein [Ferruginibacter sp.]